MIELMVLMRLMPSAPPRFTARPISRMLRDVGRQLGQHRDARDFLDPRADHLGIFRDLPDGRSHSALAHAVRAAEIQLKAVHADILDALDDAVPCLALGFDHHRGDHGIVRDACV